MDILRKEEAIIKGVEIVFDTDHRMNTLQFDCDLIHGTSKPATKEHKINLLRVLGVTEEELKKGIKATFFFSNHILVAISNEEGKRCCDLATGEIIPVDVLYQKSRLNILYGLVHEVKFLMEKIKNLQLECEFIKQETFPDNWKEYDSKRLQLQDQLAKLRIQLNDVSTEE